MKKILSAILVILLLLGTSTLFADQISLLGTVQIGRTIFNKSDNISIPVRFMIQNQSQDAWVYSANLVPTYSYVVYNVNTGLSVGTGTLQLTGAQGLGVGQSDVFAVGNITLTNPAIGFYRVFITAPVFQDTTVRLTVQPSAGGAIDVK